MKGVHLAEQGLEATKVAKRLARADEQVERFGKDQTQKIVSGLGLPVMAEVAAKRAMDAANGTVRSAERVDASLKFGVFHPQTADIALPPALAEEQRQLETIRQRAVRGDAPKEEFEKLRRQYAHDFAVFLAADADRRVSDPAENLRRELGSVHEVVKGLRTEMRDSGLVDMYAPERSDGYWLYRKLGTIIEEIDALRGEVGKAGPDALSARVEKLQSDYRQLVDVEYHPAKLLLLELKKHDGLMAYLRESEAADHSLNKVYALEYLESAGRHLREALRIMQYAPENMKGVRKEFVAAAEDKTDVLARLYINESSIAENVRRAADRTYDPTKQFAFYRDALVSLYDASIRGFDRNLAPLGAALTQLEICMVTSDKVFSSVEARLQQNVIADSEKLVANYSSLLSGGKATLAEKEAAAISAAAKSDSETLYARVRTVRRIGQGIDVLVSFVPVIGSASVIKGTAHDYAATGEISPLTGVMAAVALLGAPGRIAKEAVEGLSMLRLAQLGAAAALTVPQARHMAESWAAYYVAPKSDRMERREALEEAIFSTLTLAAPIAAGVVHSKATKMMEARRETIMPRKLSVVDAAAARERSARVEMAITVNKSAEGLPFGITAEKVAAVNKLRAEITPGAEAKFARGKKLTPVEMAALVAKESETLGLPKRGLWRNEDLNAMKVLMAETGRREAEAVMERPRAVQMDQAPLSAEKVRAAPPQASALVAKSLAGDGTALARNVAVLTAQPTIAGKTLHETVLSNADALHSAVDRMRGNIETAGPVFRGLDDAVRARENWVFRTFRKVSPLATEDYARVVISLDKGKTWLLNSLSDHGEYGDLGLVVFFRAASDTVKGLGIEGVSIVRTGADDATIVVSDLGFQRLKERFAVKNEKQAIDLVVGRFRDEARAASRQMGVTSPALADALSDFTGIGDAMGRNGVKREWTLASNGRHYKTMEAAVGAVESKSVVEKVRAVDPAAAERLERAATAFDRDQPPKAKAMSNPVKEVKGKTVDSSGAPVRIDEAITFRVAFEDGTRAAFMRGAEIKGKGVSAVEKNLIGPSVTNSVAGSAFTDGLSAHYARAFEKAAAEAGLSGKVTVYQTGPMAFGFSFSGPVDSGVMARVLGRTEQRFLQSVPKDVGVKDVRTFRTPTVREGRYRVADALFGEPAEAVSPQADMNAKKLISAIHVADEKAFRDYLSLNGVDQPTVDAAIKAKKERWLRGIEDLRPALLRNGATGDGLDRLFRIYALPHRILKRAAPEAAPARKAPRADEALRKLREERTRDAAFKQRYGIPRGEMGGGVSDPELIRRQAEAKRAGVGWNTVTDDALGRAAAAMKMDENVMFNAYLRFRTTTARDMNWGGVKEARRFELFANALDKDAAPMEGVKPGMRAAAEDALGRATHAAAEKRTPPPEMKTPAALRKIGFTEDEMVSSFSPNEIGQMLGAEGVGHEEIRQLLEKHGDRFSQRWETEMKGKKDAELVAAVRNGGFTAGEKWLMDNGYPKKVADIILGDRDYFRLIEARIPAGIVPNRPVAAAWKPLSSDRINATFKALGFRFERQNATSHSIYGHPDGRRVSIPQNRVEPVAFVKRLCKQAGVEERDFLIALGQI